MSSYDGELESVDDLKSALNFFDTEGKGMISVNQVCNLEYFYVRLF